MATTANQQYTGTRVWDLGALITKFLVGFVVLNSCTIMASALLLFSATTDPSSFRTFYIWSVIGQAVIEMLLCGFLLRCMKKTVLELDEAF